MKKLIVRAIACWLFLAVLSAIIVSSTTPPYDALSVFVMVNAVILGTLGGYLGLVYMTFYASLSTRMVFLSQRQLKELFSKEEDAINKSLKLDVPHKDLVECAKSSVWALIFGLVTFSLFFVKDFEWKIIPIAAAIELITVSSYIYLFLPWQMARKKESQPP
ncbi:MAG: hypothetical protein PHP35_00030 [Candidatus Colwellbacteria bacterium]|nr:hypothetical protein [Candidatus Colwellbacteria bacterium]